MRKMIAVCIAVASLLFAVPVVMAQDLSPLLPLKGRVCIGPYDAEAGPNHHITGALGYVVEEKDGVLLLHRYRYQRLTLPKVASLTSLLGFENMGTFPILAGPFQFDGQQWDWKVVSERPPLIVYGRVESDRIVTSTDSREYQQLIGVPVRGNTNCS